MLNIAFELIGEATSNSLLMFCFCNLIIVMILTGSSKPGSTDDSTFTTPVSFNECNIASGDDNDDEEMVVDVSSTQNESVIDVSSSSDEDEDKESSHCFDEDKDDDESNEAEVEEEEGDDDLRKRVEDFIAKINNEWRHEKLRALNLVY
ncbi:unnamed protein product [Microthlaspi erraticum]|uniref:DUF4408 domain-containing protein n=1 Tax=Microthlaspi erraticum TaxID=1685480 RepID=A0A6D2IP74_9BRAS|nr:unnamed protein product [Microthlaspi erraticum]